MPPVGQEQGAVVELFRAGRVERSDGCGRAAFRGNAHQRAANGLTKHDYAFAIPGTSHHGSRDVAEGLRRAARDADLLQLSGALKHHEPAVEGPKDRYARL